MSTTESILNNITKAIAERLRVDRCFLYVRDPESRYGRAACCYCRNPDVPDVSSQEWELERPEDLEKIDPMFAAALDCQPSIYVEDVETADPKTLNREFEAREFGHRALIHGHVCEDGKLWGILQPCVFDRPRRWTTSDREIMETALTKSLSPIKQYVQTHLNRQ